MKRFYINFISVILILSLSVCSIFANQVRDVYFAFVSPSTVRLQMVDSVCLNPESENGHLYNSTFTCSFNLTSRLYRPDTHSSSSYYNGYFSIPFSVSIPVLDNGSILSTKVYFDGFVSDSLVSSYSPYVSGYSLNDGIGRFNVIFNNFSVFNTSSSGPFNVDLGLVTIEFIVRSNTFGDTTPSFNCNMVLGDLAGNGYVSEASSSIVGFSGIAGQIYSMLLNSGTFADIDSIISVLQDIFTTDLNGFSQVIQYFQSISSKIDTFNYDMNDLLGRIYSQDSSFYAIVKEYLEGKVDDASEAAQDATRVQDQMESMADGLNIPRATVYYPGDLDFEEAVSSSSDAWFYISSPNFLVRIIGIVFVLATAGFILYGKSGK